MPETTRPPFPPFDPHTAAQKVRMAEDAWNSRDPSKVLGVQRARLHAPAHCQHQRPAYSRERAQVSLAARTPS